MVFLKDFIESFSKPFILNASPFKKKLFSKKKDLWRKAKRRRVKYLKNLEIEIFKIIVWKFKKPFYNRIQKLLISKLLKIRIINAASFI